MIAADVFKILEKAADAAFVVTLEGEICFWNAAAECMFGYTAPDVLNTTCHEILHGRGALGTFVYTGECSIQRCAVQTDTIPVFDLEVTTKSGSRKWVSVLCIVFEDSRIRRRMIAHLCRDISKYKQAEQTFSQMIELSKQIVSIGETQSQPALVESLSDQERRILTLFAKAKNSSQVARELNITLPTLRNHLHAINQRLRTHNRLEAVLHAMRRGLI